MNGNELLEYLEANADHDDPIYGPQCRRSVTLKDGLLLPCVILRRAKPTVDLALRRFDEEKQGKGIFGRSKKTLPTDGSPLHHFWFVGRQSLCSVNRSKSLRTSTGSYEPNQGRDHDELDRMGF